MRKTLFVILVLAVMVLAGCQTQKDVCQTPNKMINGQCCIDDNDNNICDNTEIREVQNKTTTTAKVVDSRITDILKKQENLNGAYHYTKNYYEGESNKIVDTFEVWRKGDRMKQMYAGRTFYQNSSGIFEYMTYKLNSQYKVVSNSMLKKDTYLLTTDMMIDPVVIQENYNMPIEGMLIGYGDTAGNKYETYLVKHSGTPIEIKKISLNGDVQLIKYVGTEIPVLNSDVIMPENSTLMS